MPCSGPLSNVVCEPEDDILRCGMLARLEGSSFVA